MRSPLWIPPRSKFEITSAVELAKRLKGLVGQRFILAPGQNKARTDGSNLRKRVTAVLEATALPAAAAEDSYRILPPRAKGVTRLRREWVDTFIATSGTSYNLQVWNRNPSEPMPQIEYSDGSIMLANEIRLVLVRVEPSKQSIQCVIVATPEYIVERFGKFGKPTVKQQLLICARKRQEILSASPPILFYADGPDAPVSRKRIVDLSRASMGDPPEPQSTLPLQRIRRFVEEELIGRRIEAGPTKNRGQALELFVARGLGYRPSTGELLAGGYPDLRHQALEVKIQDGPTVDLGKYSPQFEEDVPGCNGFTTQTVRYLIALMDRSTNTCVGAVLCPGKRLTEHFVYVAEESFKCQRAMPMSFFDQLAGRSVFNPDY